MNLAKKISSLSDKELLLSDDIIKNIKKDVKTEKETRKGFKVYKIDKIKDRKKYKKFINEFLERQGKENKGTK
mgnify:FL=1